jgi:hypothetical protein
MDCLQRKAFSLIEKIYKSEYTLPLYPKQKDNAINQITS